MSGEGEDNYSRFVFICFNFVVNGEHGALVRRRRRASAGRGVAAALAEAMAGWFDNDASFWRPQSTHPLDAWMTSIPVCHSIEIILLELEIICTL
jgi:hypothetical protein